MGLAIRRAFLGCAVGLLLPAGMAVAADFGAPPEAAAAAEAGAFDVAFGVAATSDYVSRGITQTEHRPAVQGAVELALGLAYANVWASNVRFAGVDDTEVDLALGIRPELGPFALDLGYTRYLYLDDPESEAGEAYLFADYAVTEMLTIGGKGYVNPDSADVYAEAGATLALANGISVYGTAGFAAYDGPDMHDYRTWTAGASWTWNDLVTFDLRYSDSDLSEAECADNTGAGDACDARVVATVSVDSSLSALAGGPGS